jgi:hypothetical protein
MRFQIPNRTFLLLFAGVFAAVVFYYRFLALHDLKRWRTSATLLASAISTVRAYITAEEIVSSTYFTNILFYLFHILCACVSTGGHVGICSGRGTRRELRI